MDLQQAATIIALILSGMGLIGTAIGLILTARQLKISQKIARSDFLLHIDELLGQHDKVHRLLRPGGDWSRAGGGPADAGDWADVDNYMGLFERMKVLVDSAIIDLPTLNRLYGYRITNIVSNTAIRQRKLEDEKGSWEDFLALVRQLSEIRPGIREAMSSPLGEANGD